MARKTILGLLAVGLVAATAPPAGPPTTRPTCYPDGATAPCFNAQGCPGTRECASGRWGTVCIIEDPSACQPDPLNDLFTVNNSGGASQVGILVDGRSPDGTEVDDVTFVLYGTTPSTTFDVGDLRHSVQADEVISFQAG